jgi:hypothetical protein
MNKMKVAAAVVLSLCVPQGSWAQEVSWGLKGGAGFAALRVSGPDGFDTSADPGGMAGGFLGIALGEHVRLQPEFYWSVRRFAAAGAPAPFTVSSRGFEVPILLEARFLRSRPLQMTLSAGPQFSIIGSVRQRVGDVTTDIGELVKRQDAAVAVGAGVERRLANGALLVDVRGVFGVRNLAADDARSMRSRAMQVLIGYRF